MLKGKINYFDLLNQIRKKKHKDLIMHDNINNLLLENPLRSIPIGL